MIRFACENCGQRLNVPADHAGRKIRCPKCTHIAVAPAENRPELPGDAAQVSPAGSTLLADLRPVAVDVIEPDGTHREPGPRRSANQDASTDVMQVAAEAAGETGPAPRIRNRPQYEALRWCTWILLGLSALTVLGAFVVTIVITGAAISAPNSPGFVPSAIGGLAIGVPMLGSALMLAVFAFALQALRDIAINSWHWRERHS